MSADGALRDDVLAALREHGCTVSLLSGSGVPAHTYRVGFKSQILAQTMPDVISRKVLSNFVRRFGISIAAFFPVENR